MDGKILVTGGAGYIGSHMVKLLRMRGHEVLVLDNLSSGYEAALLDAGFIKGDVGDAALLESIFASHKIIAVMHFASHIQVSESVSDPAKYYGNVANTLILLDAMRRAGVRCFIFSSSAAVYGEPGYSPVDEAHPANPINPYGWCKYMIEQVLADYDAAYRLKYTSLRYFNAAGADPEGELGERHNPETHLIPLLLQAAAGQRDALTVYGKDYATPDGTCVRDYVHVWDLCEAHLLALTQLLSGSHSAIYNLGNGNGFSVQHVIDTARAVTGKEIEVRYGARRSGDSARLIADARLAHKQLGWKPRYPDLKTIIEHAWRWQCRKQE